MEKRIIALSCSPSRGRNSDTLLDEFIQGANSISCTTIEKIYLDEIPIDYYRHDNQHGPHEHEVKFRELVEKIESANGLVIATPTYNFSVPAHLKNFIDRIRFLGLDLTQKNMFGQPVGKMSDLYLYFIVTGGTPSWAQKILFFAFPPFWLRGVFLYYGAKVIGALYTGNIRAFTNTRIRKTAYNHGRKYARRIEKEMGTHILEKIFWRPPQVE